MASLNQRLAVLEGRVPAPSSDGHALELGQLTTNLTRWLVGWETLSQTMAPEHVAIVEAEVPDWWAWTCHRGRAWLTFTANQFSATNHLAYRVVCLINDAAASRHAGPFVLPPAVAAVYVADDRASANDDCGDCGYVLPSHTGWSDVRGGHGGTWLDAAHDYFDACPLCGGPVGCLMYMRRHDGVPAPTYQLPDDRLATAWNEVSQHLQTIETEYLIDENGRDRGQHGGTRLLGDSEHCECCETGCASVPVRCRHW